MSEKDGMSKAMLKLVMEKKHQLQQDRMKEEHAQEVLDLRIGHSKELELRELKAKVATFEQMLVSGVVSSVDDRQADKEPKVNSPKLSEVVNTFLDSYQKDKHKEMYKKHSCTVHQLAGMDHEKTLSEGTIKDTYIASIRSFLKDANTNWQDQGFPTTLTTEGIQYRGDREEGEGRQREFHPDELKRLFEGTEMRRFASDAKLAHFYWLPHIGLFTGARVNEICQLNPQADIIHEDGIWCFSFSEDTPSDEHVDKSIKTKDNRVIPIHSQLIDLGILDYIETLKKKGDTLIFPKWKPERGRASPKAEKWFRQFIRDIGLRDETPKKRLVGMHAFRSNLLNRALNLDVDNANFITGHANAGRSTTQQGYDGTLSIENKQIVLERITFEIDYIKRS
ncbi:MAG: site-specific integrase [Candidatus Thiodiazotropha sp. (ex Ustalcina ferruginea)]|nr:site-specific integrase [Candidatus Thiodiazotropha sp. (ex Ustalcina ferruginea)]